jgi:quinol monooxygenase YgiN
MAAAKTLHDMIASGGETPAKAAGNFAHDPYLGTTLLGTTENEFLSFDRWSSDENMDAFYGNPDFQAAFMQLFATPPQLTTFLRSDFHQWGDLDAGDAATPHFAVVVRGRLADTPDLIRPEHDAVAEGGEAAAKALGDVAHVVYLGRTDEREALIVDVWTSSEAIEGFYGDPGFQAAVGALFEAPPTVGVYGSSDFHGW